MVCRLGTSQFRYITSDTLRPSKCFVSLIIIAFCGAELRTAFTNRNASVVVLSLAAISRKINDSLSLCAKPNAQLHRRSSQPHHSVHSRLRGDGPGPRAASRPVPCGSRGIQRLACTTDVQPMGAVDCSSTKRRPIDASHFQRTSLLVRQSRTRGQVFLPHAG